MPLGTWDRGTRQKNYRNTLPINCRHIKIAAISNIAGNFKIVIFFVFHVVQKVKVGDRSTPS